MIVLSEIKQLLDQNKIKYSLLEHEPVYTSEQAAQIRGRGVEEGLKRGAKAMIVRAEGKFYQFVIAAHKRISFKKVKQILKTKSVSLATAEEVKQITNCTPGSVPPFGNLFSIPVYMDKSLLLNEEIDFNAGRHEVSITMKREDWQRVVSPIVEDFSEE